MSKQLDYVIDRCVTAMDAGMPIIFLETEDMALLDRLFYSERLVPYWSRHKELDKEFKGWQEMTDEERQEHQHVANVNIFSGRLTQFFSDVNPVVSGATSKPNENESFVAEHDSFEYLDSRVCYVDRRIMGCRNYRGDDSSAQMMQRLVGKYISANPGDAILRCTIILQAPVVNIPDGIANYVEVITVPPLSDEEIKEEIMLFARQTADTLPYTRLLDTMIVSLRGFTQPKIVELLRKIRSKCGSIARNLYDPEVPIEQTAIGIITGEKKQMLQKSGLLRSRKVGNKEAAGLDHIKQWVRQRKQLIENSLDAKRDWALDAPKGVLISGIPGTGKSLLAEEVARILELPLVQMDMGALRSKYQGESERNMRRVIHLAESLAPCVPWIDEIEKAFSGTKGSGDVDGGTTMRIFASFLTWMQEKSAACFIFATANDVSMLPSELLRRGRFDQKFFTFMPTKAECQTIFRSCIEGKNGVYRRLFDPEITSREYLESVLSFCGEHGKFLTGADIEGIVADAKSLVFFDTRENGLQVGDVKYSADTFRRALESAILEVRPYGETNKEDIVKCLTALVRNRFAPASATNLIDVSKVDLHAADLPPYQGRINHYDEKLYAQVSTTWHEMKEAQKEKNYGPQN